MTTSTVWKFDSEGGARNALQVLERLQKEELLQVVDAAILTWPSDRKKPKTDQLRSLTRGEFKGTGAHLASSNLSSEQEAKLREVFAEDEAQTQPG